MRFPGMIGAQRIRLYSNSCAGLFSCAKSILCSGGASGFKAGPFTAQKLRTSAGSPRTERRWRRNNGVRALPKRWESFSTAKASIVRMPAANGSSIKAAMCCSMPTMSPCRSFYRREIGVKNGSSCWIPISRSLKKKSATNRETKSRSSHAPSRCSVV